MKKGLLTFEIAKDGELLEIHADQEGLKRFVSILNNIIEQKPPTHEHLMTPSWGGDELGTDKQGINNKLLDSVKIFIWES